ncbi:MAG: putative linear pentadecapeptide gramicidin synthetase LgrB, partial [Myxococcaceae bacterium]|nr:putative linear pentadecapeptide gramicidin synthetase LgrB [Myxococcaceae bacterium]
LPELLTEHRTAWQRVWGETYGVAHSDAVDPRFDVSGWRSSYTGQPIPEAEMLEWVELSVANILAEKPRRVLEIGCGTGLLALRIASHCEDYLATDASQVVLEQLNRCQGNLPIRTACHLATELGVLPARSFDAVILNSVVQYLSSQSELSLVLEHAIRATAPGGFVYVGDVRDLALLDAFYASLELTAQPRLSKARLRERIARRRSTERELVIHADFFHRLQSLYPNLVAEVRPKRGLALNEVTRFRFDVVLRVGAEREQAAEPIVASRDWVGEEMTLAGALRELRSTKLDRLAFWNIPNARIVTDPALAGFCGAPSSAAPALNSVESLIPYAVDPEALRSAAAEAGGFTISLEITRAEHGGTFNALFSRLQTGPRAPRVVGPLSATGDHATAFDLTNDPLRLAVERALVARARVTVEARLPSYMMPARFVVLRELPSTPNGKIDRRALMSSCSNALDESEYVAPRTDVEVRAAEIWSSVLGVERVGVEDDFFHLGGNSLLAIKVLSRITQAFACELSVRDLFEQRTLGAFSSTIAAASPLLAAPLLSGTSALTLSFGQERLLFLDLLEPGNWTYNMPAAVRIDGLLDVVALQEALTQLIRRHDVLASSFVIEDGRPSMRIHQVEVELQPVDLRALPDSQRSERVETLAREEARRPFDLTAGPLIRATLLRTADQTHVLLLTLHHIAADGWSLDILVRDLTALWASGGDAARAALPPLKMRYADFAAWQRKWLDAGRLNEGLTFWKALLEGYPYQLLLPTDRPRPKRPSGQGRRYPFAFPPALLARLHEVAAREETTLFMVLLTGMGILVGRYSGEPRVVVGTALANRPLPEVEELIGFFVNSLAMPVDLSQNPTVEELLRRVRKTSVDAFAHGSIPFEKVVDEVLPARDLSRHPIFQVLLILQNAPHVDLDVADLHLEVVEVDPEIARFDIGVSAYETQEGLKGFVEYATELFDEPTIARMVGHLERVLTWMVDRADARLSELSMLSDAESHRIVHDWNDTQRPYCKELCIHDLVEAQAKRTPTRLAVESEGRQLTYAELDRHSNQLAHYLRELGVGPEVLVGICVDRSVDMFVGLLAVLKAGGAYVPLDPSYPMDRLAFMLKDSGAKVVLTKARVLGDLSELDIREVRLDESRDSLASRPETALVRHSLPTNLAYVIYTSGSTGRPKGVGCPHTGVINLLAEVATWAPLPEGFRGGQWTSLSFDASIYEIFAVLAMGGALCAVPEGVRADGTMLLDWIEQEKIASAYLPPHVLTDLADRADRVGARFPLRRLLIGIEPIPEELLARIRRALPGLEIVNAYGPTETTVMATRHIVERDDAVGQTPIGTPIANTTTYVLDGDMRPVPAGVVGELWIGGDGQTRAYLNQPALTAERFVPNPYGAPGSRLYRTGDVVRWLKTGTLEFVGRADNQIKLRGFRVELGEIEMALTTQPGVREGAVVVREDDRGQKRIVAYLVGDNLDTATMRANLAVRLPDHMVPSLFITLQALPLTPSGKIDRRALPTPSWNGALERSVPARTETESKLVEVWQTVLRVDPVGVTDNFFELGGDSIIAIQVVSRARLAGVPITPKDLFSHQTIEALAKHVIPQRTFLAAQGVVAGDVAATPIIARFMDESVEDRSHFNQAVMLELSGAVDVDALTAASSAVVAHHDALRMRLRRPLDSGWQLHIVPEEHCAVLECVELAGANHTEVCQRIHESLDLEDGPLIRAALLRDRAGVARLFIVSHHLVIDAVSWRVLLEDLERAYVSTLAGRPVALGEKTTSYQDWAARLASFASTAAGEHSLGRAYWTERSSTIPAALPTDFEGGQNRVADVDVISVELDAATTEALLTEVPEAYRTRINEALLTAVVRAFNRWTGEDDLVLDLEGHGREELFDDIDLSRTVGWFTSIFPVHLRGGSSGLVETLRTVKETLRRVPSNGVGYGVLRYLGNPEVRSALTRVPPADVSFNYLGQIDRTMTGLFALSDQHVGQVQSGRSVRAHRLDIEAQVSFGKLRVSMHYSRAVHRRETVEAIARGILRELAVLVDHCRSAATLAYTPSDFPLAQLSQKRLDALVGCARIDGLYPLSPLQEGMLFHEVLDPSSRIYCEQLVGTLRGRLRTQDLRRAWELLAERHTILRTVFHWRTEGRPLQLVQPRAQVEWRELELSGADGAMRIEQYLKEDKERGFELDQAPPWRLALMRVRDDEHVLVFTHHHLLLDGWSYNVLFRNLLDLYTALGESDAPTLGPVDAYERFVTWLESRDRASASAFWRASLSEVTAPTFLTQSPSARVASSKDAADARATDEHATEISAATTAALERLGRSRQLTVSGVVASAWAVLLSRHLGRRDVVFGMTESGRPTDLVGVEQAMGLFINTVPLRVQVDDVESVEALARRVI